MTPMIDSAVWVPAFAGTTSLRRLRDDAVAAVVLGAVERGVGALQHIADRLAFALEDRQPDRDRDLDPLGPLVDRKRLARDGTAKPFCDHPGDMQVGLGHYDDELLAAIAAGEIDAAGRLSGPPP